MAKYALVSVDLACDSKQRERFNEAMKELKWTKRTRLTTIWTCSWTSSIMDASAIAVAKEDVKKSAIAAGITAWQAIVQVGESPAEEY